MNTDPNKLDELEETKMVKKGIYTMFISKHTNIVPILAV